MKNLTGFLMTALLVVSVNGFADVYSSTVVDDEADAPTLYQVKPGDTLWDISEAYYGTPDVWGKISKDNDVPVPVLLQPGKVLNLDELMKPVPSSFPGVVTHLTGPVWRVTDGQRQPLARGEQLQVGAMLESGVDGFVAVEFADGASITLPSNTRVTLEARGDGAGVSVELADGEVESRIPRSQTGAPNFDVVTPTGNLGVRGTHFRVAYSDSAATTVSADSDVVGTDGDLVGTTTSVLEGLVDASFRAGRTNVAAGQGVWARDGKFAVVSLLPAPRLESSSEALNDTLTLMLSEVAGAKKYRVQLATDADFYRVVRDSSTTTRELDFLGLDEGLYHLRLTAIDNQGIEGVPGKEMMFYHPVGAQVSYRQGEWIFNWNSRPRSSYRLELSASEDFRNPIVDREMSGSKGAFVRNLPAGEYFWRLTVSHEDEGSSHLVGSGKLNDEARRQ